MKSKIYIGKEFIQIERGMTRTSANGTMSKRYLIEDKLDSGMYRCRLIHSESWGNREKNYKNDVWKFFTTTEIDRVL